ncbi:hypothetical protein ABE096_19925 [Robertmurraya massiliosenegalensis]
MLLSRGGATSVTSLNELRVVPIESLLELLTEIGTVLNYLEA